MKKACESACGTDGECLDKVSEDELTDENDPIVNQYHDPHIHLDEDKVIDKETLKELASQESKAEELTHDDDDDAVREMTYVLLEEKEKAEGTNFMRIM